MERLDHAEAAGEAVKTAVLSSREIAESLADLAVLFGDAEPATRHRILQALFEQVGVLGPNEVWLYPSVEAEARGWAAAMGGSFRMEERKTGRGERACTSHTDLRVDLIRLVPDRALTARSAG